MANNKTVIVTGTSQGIGAAVVQAFLDRGYNVVATSRSVSKAGFAPSPNLALVDGDIGQAATAEKVARTAVDKFGLIDHVVNNAGIFAAKPFTDYTADDFRGFVSTNLEGFIFITQLAVKQMLTDTPMHKNDPKDFPKTLSPMGTISDPKDIADAVIYLAEARQVTGEVLHVDDGAHVGRW